jgi:PAS domain S-box-containing protein
MNPYSFSNTLPGYVEFGSQPSNAFTASQDTYTSQPPPPPHSYVSAPATVANNGPPHSNSMDFSLAHKNDYDLVNSMVTASSDMTASLMSAIDANVMMRPAARPLPSSTNTNDFTKRKNWDQRIIEELTDFLHVLSPVGKILFASPSSVELIGYTPDELHGRSITDFLHSDDIDMFIREFNLAIHTRSEFKLYYRFRKKDDKFVTFEVIGHPYFGGTGNSEVPKCFFGIAQPYPTKAGTMLDSFLELKIENEKLRNQLKLLQSSPSNEKLHAVGDNKTFSTQELSVSTAQDAVMTTSNYTNIVEPQHQGSSRRDSTDNNSNNGIMYGSRMDLDHHPVALLSTIEFPKNDTSSSLSGRSLKQNAPASDTSRATTNLSSASISPKAIHKQYDGRVTIPTGASGMSSLDNDTKSKQRKKVS